MNAPTRVAVLISAIACLAGCATGSVRMLGETATFRSGDCEVTVYETKDQAIENGMSKEVCVVEESSAMSFDHSINGAIKNNIAKVCTCGVTKAYVQTAHTESDMGIKGVSYVSLVGFR